MDDHVKHGNEYTNTKRKFNPDEITHENRPNELSVEDDGPIDKPTYESTRMDNPVKDGNEYTNKMEKFNTDEFLHKIIYKNQPDENKCADCLEKNRCENGHLILNRYSKESNFFRESNGNVFTAESDCNKNTTKHYLVNKVRRLKRVKF
jgi:hypothetical protein